ncbi:hypothetical protein CEXT_677961 [Caerostris extrusa]|uniref:Uncharacterized protein n=1 Tax=Caerostris extrusa TaxID=172846 RepID=A0AAV4NPE5_CAEEX|nr:hypothetical protein CEXT_677961 [Caerostris extrusa]
MLPGFFCKIKKFQDNPFLQAIQEPDDASREGVIIMISFVELFLSPNTIILNSGGCVPNRKTDVTEIFFEDKEVPGQPVAQLSYPRTR